MGVEEFFDSDVVDDAGTARGPAPRWAHPAVLIPAGLVVVALIFLAGVLLV